MITLESFGPAFGLPDPSRGGDPRIGDNASERERRLLEGDLDTRTKAAQTNICIMGKLLPSSADSQF